MDLNELHDIFDCTEFFRQINNTKSTKIQKCLIAVQSQKTVDNIKL